MTAPDPNEPIFMRHRTTGTHIPDLPLRLAIAEERRDFYASEAARHAAENLRLRSELDRLKSE